MIWDEIWAKSDGTTSLVKHTQDVVKSLKNTYPEMVLAAVFHDFGKINPNFQKYLREKKEKQDEPNATNDGGNKIKKIDLSEKLKNFFYGFPPIEKKIRHEFLSLLYLAYFWPLFSENKSLKLEKIANLIAWHHRNDLTSPQHRYKAGFTHDLQTQDTLISVLGNLGENNFSFPYREDSILSKFWEWLNKHRNEFQEFFKKIHSECIFKVQSFPNPSKEEFLNNCARIFRGLGYLPSALQIQNDEFVPSRSKVEEWLIPSGILKQADYLASAYEEIKKPLNSCKEEGTIQKIYENEKPLLTAQSNNLWQDKVIREIPEDTLKKSDVFILEAPTGSGKTYFAYKLAEKLGFKKLLYVLPYRAALNEKYEKAIKNASMDCVGLIHATALLEFEKALKRQEGYIQESDIQLKLIMSRYFDTPILFSTADQTMLTALEFYPYDLYLALYQNTFIILDEPQAYNPTQMAIILRTIQYALTAGAKVLIMTATFPSALYKKLKNLNLVDGNKWKTVNIYKIGFSSIEKKESNDEPDYSLDNIKVKNADLKRHLIEKIEIEKDPISEIIEKIKRLSMKSQKILVIMNTVKTATQLYKELKRKFEDKDGEKNILLLHARLGWQEKNQIIMEIRNKKKRNWILITTQVVEAAIDVDADVLVTVLSPIPSQVQRWGRVYRNREDDYKDEDPNIIIFVPKKIDNSTKKSHKKSDSNEEQFDWSTYKNLYKGVYKKFELESSLDILNRYTNNQVLTYHEEKKLVKEYYSKISDESLLEQAFVDLPYFAAAIDTKNEAHMLFRPDDYTVQIAIKEEIEPLVKDISSWQRIYSILLSNSYQIPKRTLEGLCGEGKIEISSISINGKEKSQIGDIQIISVPDYDEKKDEIKEMGLEFL